MLRDCKALRLVSEAVHDFAAEAGTGRSVKLVSEGEVTFTQVFAVLVDHLHPWTAPHRKGGLVGQVGEILIPAQKVAEALGTFDAPF